MRCRFGRFALAIASAVPFLSAAFAELPKVSPDDIRNFRDEIGGMSIDGNRMPLLRQWQEELKGVLKNGTASAAERLAPRYHVGVPQMQRLIELVLLQQRVSFPRDDAAVQRQKEHHAALVALVRDSRQNPLMLEAAAAILAGFGDCDAATYGVVINGAADPVAAGWYVTRAAACPVWQYAFLKQAGPKNFGVLIEIVHYTGLLQPAQYLALYEHLTGEAALAAVEPADRIWARAHLSYEYIELMWDLGLSKEGIAFFEALPADIQGLLLDGVLDSRQIHAGGLPVALAAEATATYVYNGSPLRNESSADHMRMLLASAYFLNGRTADAERVFAGIKAIDKMRNWFACSASWKSGDNCDDLSRTAPGYILLDHLLHHPGDDPYMMAEQRLHADGGLFAAMSCRVFPDAAFDGICENARMAVVDSIRPSRESDPGDTRAADTTAAITAAVSGFAASEKAWHAKLEQAAVAQGDKGFGFEARRQRPSIDPLPSPFAQLPLPEQYRGKPEQQDPSWVKHLAKLPQGFEPVRIERDGARVVAITVSQNYDPTGEVSPGGFWVHVSDDGGKTWQAPLYTGLAFAFPYVVLQESKLPLIDGDTLNVAVDIQLLDTASIMYPPVALQSRKHETNLYLKIPLADLRRDSDGDGLTDIAETHLLLDPHNPDSDGDGLPDGVDPMPNVKHTAVSTPEQQAVQLLLEKLFAIRTGAIIQKIDHGGGEDAILSAITSVTKNDPNSATRPIFVEGEKNDFAGLIPSRMMLIYSAADIAKLQRMTPDFHAVSFGKIIFNRAHTRGFFSYSFGWSGGTVRLLWQNGQWKMEEISSWIS